MKRERNAGLGESTGLSRKRTVNVPVVSLGSPQQPTHGFERQHISNPAPRPLYPLHKSQGIFRKLPITIAHWNSNLCFS